MTKIPPKTFICKTEMTIKFYITTLLAFLPPKSFSGTYKFSFVIKLLYFVVYLSK